MRTLQLARLPFMAAAMVALVTGLWAGLLRLGWAVPIAPAPLRLDHGPLMVCGFLGTLIGLERAVALGHPAAYAAPALSAAGALVLLAGAPAGTAPLLMTAGSAALVGVFVVLVRRQPRLFTVTMAAGALAWLAGNARWLAGAEIPEAVTWWAGFLVLTIAGERLELSRLLPVARADRGVFLTILVLFAGALFAGGVGSDGGARATGAAFLALTLWLLRHDVARRTIRQPGLPRFTAVALLSGYLWLGAGGLLALHTGSVVAGPAYDAVMHAVFVGFVFAMIFGHAPIIFPAVLGVPVAFRPAFYLHLAALHLSLAVRVVGDLAALESVRRWGGLLNAVAVLLFLGNTARAVWLGRPAARSRRTPARVAGEGAVAGRPQGGVPW
jgi:hypothetical protein